MTDIIRKSGRCFVIRAYCEKAETSGYITDVKNARIGKSLHDAYFFLCAKDAEKALAVLNERKTKRKKKEEVYSLYISKAFYGTKYGFGGKLIITPIKLTKPDRYDFINGI
jgi:hypothetical protein